MREDITFGQLRTFVCAATLGSFVKAADQLGISQPAVSDQIATLERRLRQTLFHRRRGTTSTLTPNGMAVLQDAENILAASENLLASTTIESGRDRISIAIGSYLRDTYLNPLIGKICRRFPNIDIDLRPISSSREALKQLKLGELDLVVCSQSPSNQDHPGAIKICDVPVAFVVAPSVRAALERGETTLDDLEYLIPVARDGRTVRWVNQLLKEAKLSPAKPPRYLDNAEMVCRMAKEGLGAAYLMPETITTELEEGSLEILDLKLRPMGRITAMRPAPHPAVRYIEAQLRKAILRNARKIERLIAQSL